MLECEARTIGGESKDDDSEHRLHHTRYERNYTVVKKTHFVGVDCFDNPEAGSRQESSLGTILSTVDNRFQKCGGGFGYVPQAKTGIEVGGRMQQMQKEKEKKKCLQPRLLEAHCIYKHDVLGSPYLIETW